MMKEERQKRVILKLGGSLIEKGRSILRFLRDYAEENALTILVVPGGGPFAEAVRALSDEFAMSEETVHWMAVLAMHQYGLFLANGELEMPLVGRMEEIDVAGHICIVLPYKMLRADDCLPHTWDVTSDTIAAFVANKLGEKTFVKLTDVDGIVSEEGHVIEEISAQGMVERGERGCVDAALPGFLMQKKMSCVVVNGNFTDRIIAVIEGKETLCTRLSYAVSAVETFSFSRR
jgi:aspartokinase-like uncharacterized kinase